MGAFQVDEWSGQTIKSLPTSAGSVPSITDTFFGNSGGNVASPIDAATGVDPWSGALLSAGSNVLGKALSPASAPSKADAANTAIFDNSGWAINFGSGSLDATSSKLPQMGGGVNTSMIIWAVVGLVAWKIWNKKSK